MPHVESQASRMEPSGHPSQAFSLGTHMVATGIMYGRPGGDCKFAGSKLVFNCHLLTSGPLGWPPPRSNEHHVLAVAPSGMTPARRDARGTSGRVTSGLRRRVRVPASWHDCRPARRPPPPLPPCHSLAGRLPIGEPKCQVRHATRPGS